MTRWILFVILPLVFALYASYPPVGTKVEERLVKKVAARTPEQASAHGVAVGEQYVESEEVVWRRFLPLALGQRETESEVVERPDEDTIVERQTTRVRGRVKLGLDVAGGTELLYELKPQQGQRLGGKVADTIQILKKRIDPSNVKEIPIRALEHDRILIQIPQATPAEVERDKKRLKEMGKLEFKLAVPRSGSEARFARLYEEAEAGQIPEGFAKMHLEGDPSREYYLVEKGEPAITGERLAASKLQPTTDQWGRPAVGFQFDSIGVRQFAGLTETNRGRALAIVLDGVLKSAPTIQERILGAGQITGDFTQEQVNDMLNVLRSGSLPMDIELLQESTVGPQIGRDSIRRGLEALAVAGLLVLIFIGVYYIRCGMVADAALIFNLVLLVGVLCVLGAALTLPGMAGILLTVGMAVDANVLIFERIREESAEGKGLRVALRNGYDRAFTTIIDANVTTLLTAVILYLIGTGPVRGFAVTLSFGILLSMFTALVVTRLAFETMIEKGWLHEFKMLSLMGRSAVGFSRIRKPAYLMSVAVVVIGIGALALRGSRLYDIDFTGGLLIQLSLAEPTPVSEVRARLAESGFPDAEVQGIRTASATGEGLTEFGVRVKGAGVEKLRETVLPEVEAGLSAAGLFGEGSSLKATSDGRGLELELAGPVEEADLRSALGELVAADEAGGAGNIGTIVPDETVRGTEVLVGLQEVSVLAERRELWNRALRALAWAGLAGSDYRIVRCELTEAAGGPELELVLDSPVQVELLEAELDRRQFPQIEALAGGKDGTAFRLRAEGDVLEQFQREFPEGTTLTSVPRAQIDGLEIAATLSKEFSEQDIRALLEKAGIPTTHIVLMGAPSARFRLNLSYEPVRERIEGAFANLARRAGGATFEPVADDAEAGDTVRVKMTLGEPMAFADVRHYIEEADVGPYADELIVGRDRYAPDVLVSELTLRMPRDRAAEIQGRIGQALAEPRAVEKVVSIGPTVAEEMQGRALLAVIFASVIIVLYVAVRFHAFRFGVAAVIALVHDIIITAGLVALADWSGVMGDVKISLATLAAFLTIMGYSLNDTIVVFDRIRENMVSLGRKVVGADLIDLSINQTLSRTILTSVTTLMVVVVLYLLGGPVLQGLAFTLIIGVVVGTYSSMFIASPILLDWAGLVSGTRVFFKVVFLPVTLPFKLIGMLLGGRR